MNQITVVGLGPGSPNLLTGEARDVLFGSHEIYVRTGTHPVVAELPRRITVVALDHLYQRRGELETANQTVARQLVALGRRPSGVVYATPGHPVIDDDSVREIRFLARSEGVSVRMVAGMSYLDALVPLLPVDRIDSDVVIVDAVKLIREHGASRDRPGDDPFAVASRIDPVVPLLVTHVQSSAILIALIPILRKRYPADHRISVIQLGSTTSEEAIHVVPLAELDSAGLPTAPLAIYLPPVERLADLASFDTLRYIVARLRAPGGCPWDREQTHESMKKYLIEESYEAIAALEEGDLGKFVEELGDVLLQVIMHCQLAREEGTFELEDVLRAVNEKLIRRHPHVFGDVQASSSAEVLRNWERIKRAENGDARSSFARIPPSMPALLRADAVQSRAARHGWSPPAGPPNCSSLAIPDLDRAELARRLGEILFDLVAVARRHGVDPEEALRLATNRFVEQLEARLAKADATPPLTD